MIKSIPSQHTNKLETLVMNGLLTGLINEGLDQEIKKLGHNTDNRARLIPTDQVGKIYGTINEKRQSSMGVEASDWQDSNNDHIRPLCASHHGKAFKWDTQPKDEHPRQKIKCRCMVLPNYEDILVG